MSKLKIKGFTALSPEELEIDINKFIEEDPNIEVVDFHMLPSTNEKYSAFCVYFDYDEDFYY